MLDNNASIEWVRAEASHLVGSRKQRRKWPPIMQQTWHDQAACRGLDPDIFYPLTDEEAEDAKRICAGCAVSASCLEHALSDRELEGVWGGATERDRRRIIRQRRRSA